MIFSNFHGLNYDPDDDYDYEEEEDDYEEEEDDYEEEEDEE